MNDGILDRAVRSMTGGNFVAAASDDSIAAARRSEWAVQRALRLARAQRFRALQWFGIGRRV